MNIRRTTRTRRAVVAAAMAAVATVTVAGCGSGNDDDPKPQETVSSSQPPGDDGSPESTPSAPATVDTNVKLAEVAGRGGLVLVVHQIKRDSGGFITVNAEIKNPTSGILPLSGMEGAEISLVQSNPNSVAGATLVDTAQKKRYYVLRDTDNRCLCTTALLPLQAGKSTPIFVQFPTPPPGTTSVELNVPTFAAASLNIAG